MENCQDNIEMTSAPLPSTLADSGRASCAQM